MFCTTARGVPALFSAALMLVFAGMAPAGADCFDFKSDSFSEPRTVKLVSVAKTETVDGALNPGAPPRQKVWIGNGDYLAVQMSARSKPKLLITRPGGTEVLAESWPLNAQDGYDYAEINFAGQQAHNGGDGWVDIVFSSEGGAGDQPYKAWIYTIEKISNPGDNHCDASFVSFQGGSQCETCASEPAAPSTVDYCACGDGLCCSDDGLFGVPSCVPGTPSSTGFCQ